MRVRVAMGALLLVVAVGFGAWAARSPQAVRPVMQTGWVHMTSSEDGLTTVITVTGRQPTVDGVDVIDRAFRLQHLQPQPLTYEGPASVTHRPNQLVVAVAEGQGWRFPVAGKPITAGATPAQFLEVPVRGLSQHWGPSIRRSHDEVVSMLLTGVCAAAAGTGTCDLCATGGSGSDGCDIDCGDTSCSTECGGGTHACCNCPGSCVCCPDRQSSAPVKKWAVRSAGRVAIPGGALGLPVYQDANPSAPLRCSTDATVRVAEPVTIENSLRRYSECLATF